MKDRYDTYRTFLKTIFRDYGKLLFFVIVMGASLAGCVHLYFSTVQPKLSVSFLDVGQGDSILIRTPGGHSMLIDGGPDNKVLERLSSELPYFDRHIDIVVATHADADHITGLIGVLKKYEIDHVIFSPVSGHTGIFSEFEKSVNKEHTVTSIAKQGNKIIFGDGVVAYILYPEANFHGNEKDTNDASVSLVLTYGEESVLLTGDLSSTYEGKLLQPILPHEVTIYKAGHHGSKYSSGDRLLSYIHPTYAVISAGKDNRYGHPNSETMGRLKIYAKQILSTVDKGTITFLLDGSRVSFTTTK